MYSTPASAFGRHAGVQRADFPSPTATWRQQVMSPVATIAAPVFARFITHSGMPPTPSLWHSSLLKWQQFFLRALYCSTGYSCLRNSSSLITSGDDTEVLPMSRDWQYSWPSQR